MNQSLRMFLSYLNSLLTNFWLYLGWETGKDKKSTIIREKKQGRFKMIDFNVMNEALKVAWIPHLQTRSDALWKSSLKPPSKSWRNIIPFTMHLWRHVLAIKQPPRLLEWHLKILAKHQVCFSKEHFPRNEIIWNNHNATIDRNAPFYKIWLEKNILRVDNVSRVEDLLYNNGNFLPFNPFNMFFWDKRRGLIWKMC